MAKLDVYRAKRDFEVTPEPPPERAHRRPTEQALAYIIHKHHARRLHYDLRLELEGALASWAVPKGPSYDPAVKRLAVETEDHPLAYGGFEGRIPDGEYGAGDSLIWDRGTWDTVPPGRGPEQRRKGHLEIDLRGEKLQGRWHLVRTRPSGGKPSWLLFKAKDETARPEYDVVTARPDSVASGRSATRGPVFLQTMRAPHPPPIDLLVRIWPPPPTGAAGEARDAKDGPRRKKAAVPAAPGRKGARQAEKAIGPRALAALSGGRVALQGEDAHDLAARFPGVVVALAQVVVGEAVLDGRVSQKGARARVTYLASDLLWLEGEDLRGRAPEERRQLLESLLATAPDSVTIAERHPAAKGLPRRQRATHDSSPRPTPRNAGRGSA